MSAIILPTKRQEINEPGKSYLEQGLRRMLDLKFARSDLFQVLSEKHIYNNAMVEIWAQAHGRLPEVCEVRFNGEWVCDISETMEPDFAYARIIQGLKTLKQKLERRIS